MKVKHDALTVTATSPASASTVVHSETLKGGLLTRGDSFVIDATLQAGAGGTLDVYLQRKLAADTWADWIHFPQLSAGTAARYAFAVTGANTSITVVGRGTDASPNVALAANTNTNVMPGGDVRIVFVAGASTSAGASNTIRITPYSERT